MHTAKTANETLEFLWNNHLTLCEQVDLGSMSHETLRDHIQRNSSVRPFRISTWLARQGFFIAAWSLWEYYSRNLCQSLPIKEKKKHESMVDWVVRSLTANGIIFTDQTWFTNANCLRNLIAHNGARINGPKAKGLLQRSRVAFPGIDTWQDGYIDITHDHVTDLQIKIENFIDENSK